MNESHARESEESDSGEDDPPPAVLALTRQRLGGSDLACCCSLALLAHELSGGRRCRVEVTGDRSVTADDPDGTGRDGTAEGDPGWHRIPARPSGARGVPEAWLAVERRAGERTPPGLGRLSPLATIAGLMLARHRLVREARRARRDAREVRRVLGHTLRGHLHTTLLRTDFLLQNCPEDGNLDAALVRGRLEDLKDTVLRMEEEIREMVDESDAPEELPEESATGSREELGIPELLRVAAESDGDGEAAPSIDVQGQIPVVRGDPRQIEPAFEDLFDLARRSLSMPTLSVRPENSPSGVRIELSVELDPFTDTTGESGEGGVDAGASTGGPRSDGPAGSEPEENRPSLRDIVDRLGGRLRVEADDQTRATVVVILPAGEGD